MRILFVILFIFSGTLVFGQKYFNAKLVFKDGSIINGYSSVPDVGGKKLYFKSSLTSEPEDLSRKDLVEIVYKFSNGKTCTMHKRLIRRLVRKKKAYQYKDSKGDGVWFYLKYSNSGVNYYVVGQQYSLNAKGELTIGSVGFPQGFIGHYLQRPNEERVTYISADSPEITMFKEKAFRFASSWYFKDNPGLKTRIENKEFHSSQLEYICDLYISEM